MLKVDVRTQCSKIATLEVLNLKYARRGKTRYKVTYKLPNRIRLEFEVLHFRNNGVVALLGIIFKRLENELGEFFSLPEDKIVGGMIRCTDIPERYKEAFCKYSPVNTGGYIGKDMALYVSDIEGWLRMMKTGVRPMWD
jgi:hypothetical protein